ncbi:hypothetical protein GW17_00030924 [Ensete ventricosum]|nr:hypothetical protein GW17_00030924 [Ensete ventricosum]
MSSAWAAAPAANAAAFGRHLTGWWPLLLVAALAGHSLGRGAAPCGLAVGSRNLRPGRGRMPLTAWPGCPLRLGRWWQPLAGWPQPVVPVGLLPLRVATPLQGGLGCNRSPLAEGLPPLQGSWPWPCPAAPFKGFLRCENIARTRRSYIPVFQIQMEKMKEVKRPSSGIHTMDLYSETPPI